jgi:chaperonin cofactor prefoldin
LVFGSQAELEAKVMGLMEEKESRVAEAESLRRDLQGRIQELQEMVAKLDHKA